MAERRFAFQPYVEVTLHEDGSHSITTDWADSLQGEVDPETGEFTYEGNAAECDAVCAWLDEQVTLPSAEKLEELRVFERELAEQAGGPARCTCCDEAIQGIPRNDRHGRDWCVYCHDNCDVDDVCQKVA